MSDARRAPLIVFVTGMGRWHRKLAYLVSRRNFFSCMTVASLSTKKYLNSKTSPFFPSFIVSPPVYSYTAFLDDFFWRPFPYTQVEATRVFRTHGESSPLSKETSRVCAQKARASAGVCQTLVVRERSHLEMKGEEMLWRQARNLFY